MTRPPVWPELRRALGRLVRTSPLSAAALAILAAAILAAVFAESLAPRDPLAHDLDHRLQAPGAAFPMGTDNFGRDTLSRVIHGARTSLAVGVLAAAAGSALGTALGVASGFAGGRVDLWGQRAADALLAFPALILALIMVAALGPSTGTVIAAIGAALVPQTARVARARCLELKEQEFVTAARAVGASPWRIMYRHLLPGSLPPVLILATGFAGHAMVLEAALSYLGLGVPPPHPSWGRMIQEGAQLYLETAPWLTVFPGLALSVLVISFALLGDGLRDLFDPRERHRAAPLQTTGRQGNA